MVHNLMIGCCLPLLWSCLNDRFVCVLVGYHLYYMPAGYGANEARSRYEELLITNYTLSMPKYVNIDDRLKRGGLPVKANAGTTIAGDTVHKSIEAKTKIVTAGQVKNDTRIKTLSDNVRQRRSVIDKEGVVKEEPKLDQMKEVEEKNKQEIIASQ